jgi:histidinol-phosphate/aromatic aminotransferase/cobyric acid decarboxylase-like protein
MQPKEFSPKEILVDRGFDAEFSWERINEMCRLFSDDETVQRFIYDMHLKDNALDLKRGEFYPEILRAIISLKRSLSTLYELDLVQVQPNFGSNGSIDTVLAAVKVEETRRLSEGEKTRWMELSKSLESSSLAEAKLSNVSRLVREFQGEKPAGGALFTSPTYFRNYNSASAKQLAIHLVPLREDLEFDSSRFVSEMLRLKPSIVFLVTPNNPTGLPIPDKDILLVLDNLSESTWALMDRTLANTRAEVSTHELLHRYQHKNLVVLHSFSKYKGMSHHRIGVALYSNPTMARIVQPNLPLGLALEGCIKANRIVLEERGIFPSERIIANIKANNALLRTFVRERPNFSFTDFSGNYCLLVLPERLSSQTVTKLLASHGLFVEGGHEFPEPNNRVIRLHTGGPPEYIQRMCEVLR